MSRREDPTAVERPRSGSDERVDADEPSAFDPPATANARFEERRELGRGGMGRVAEAHDIALGRDVAVKHMLSDDPVGLARFAREARITARLEHPSIVPLYDAGRNSDGTPFYVMRKVDGQPLDQLVETRDVLADRLALVPNVLAATDAVAYAHARRIVHRDIKPTNILVGAFGETLLIDWGLARESEGPAGEGSTQPVDDGETSDVGMLTHAGTIAGTPGFMAPEQARGEAIDARADVFALGATLYYVLARMPPYAASTSGTAMIAQVAAEHPPDWSKLPAEVPIDLRAIVLKAMAPARADRYADAGALAADLRRFIAGNLVGARDYGAFEQLRRWVRRHRAVMGVALASALILAIVATLAVRRVIAERDDARVARDLATSAQALAEQRQREALELADRQLLARAEALLGKDLIATIATLRELRAGSPYWPAAAALLEGARLHGIPFGFALGNTPVRSAISPDSRHAFVLELGGTISLIDLVARTRTVIDVEYDHLVGATWLGADIAVVDTDRILRIDRTGAVLETILPPTKIRYLLATEDGTKLWVVTERTIFALSGQPGARVWTPMIRDVEDYAADRSLDQVLVLRKGRLVVWRPDGEQDLGPATMVPPFTGQANWFALQEGALVARYERRAGSASYVKVDEWQLKGVLMLAHVGKMILGHHNGRTVTLANGGGIWDTGPTAMMMMDGEHGIVVVRDAGRLDLLEPGLTSTLQSAATPLTRASWSRDGRFVVGVSVNRELVIWDRAAFQPHIMALDSFQNVVDLDAQGTMWSAVPGRLLSDNFETGAHSEVEVSSYVPVMRISGDRRWLGALMGDRAHLVDVVTRVSREFRTRDIIPLADGMLLADGPIVRRFTDRAPDGEVLMTYASAPDLVVQRPGHLVATFGALLVQDDLTSRQRTELRASAHIDYLALSHAGEVYVVIGGKLHTIRADTLVAIDLPPPCIEVAWTNMTALVRCANALFEVSGTTVRGVGSNVRRWAASDRLVVYHRGTNQLVFVDRATGTNIPLDAEFGFDIGLWTDGTRVLVTSIEADRRLVRMYRFEPARSEVELRARLAAITNATANAGGITWPEH